MPLDIETPSWLLIYKDTLVIEIPQGDNPIAIERINQYITDSFERCFKWFSTVKKLHQKL